MVLLGGDIELCISSCQSSNSFDTSREDDESSVSISFGECSYCFDAAVASTGAVVVDSDLDKCRPIRRENLRRNQTVQFDKVDS